MFILYIACILSFCNSVNLSRIGSLVEVTDGLLSYIILNYYQLYITRRSDDDDESGTKFVAKSSIFPRRNKIDFQLKADDRQMCVFSYAGMTFAAVTLTVTT